MKLLPNYIYKNFNNNKVLSKLLLKPKGLSIARTDKIQYVRKDEKYVDRTMVLKRSGLELESNVLKFECDKNFFKPEIK